MKPLVNNSNKSYTFITAELLALPFVPHNSGESKIAASLSCSSDALSRPEIRLHLKRSRPFSVNGGLYEAPSVIQAR